MIVKNVKGSSVGLIKVLSWYLPRGSKEMAFGEDLNRVPPDCKPEALPHGPTGLM
jgi:hypothetical protein